MARSEAGARERGIPQARNGRGYAAKVPCTHSRPGGQSDPVASPALGWLAGLVLTYCALLFSPRENALAGGEATGVALGVCPSGQGLRSIP